MYKGKTVYPTKPQNGPMDKIVNENWDKPKALLKDASKKDAQIYDNWDTKFLGGVNLRKSRKSRKFHGNQKKILKWIVVALIHQEK